MTLIAVSLVSCLRAHAAAMELGSIVFDRDDGYMSDHIKPNSSWTRQHLANAALSATVPYKGRSEALLGCNGGLFLAANDLPGQGCVVVRSILDLQRSSAGGADVSPFCSRARWCGPGRGHRACIHGAGLDRQVWRTDWHRSARTLGVSADH